MQPAQHLLVFLSLILGLALAQILTSAHRLLVARRRVGFHWIPVTWATLHCVTITQVWWALFGMIRDPIWSNFFGFVLLVALTITIYLVAALLLPDPSERGRTDLWTHYLANRRWLFGLLVVFLALISAADWLHGDPGYVRQNLIRGGLVLVFLGLARSSSERVHAAGLSLIVLSLVGFIAYFTLRIA